MKKSGHMNTLEKIHIYLEAAVHGKAKPPCQ